MEVGVSELGWRSKPKSPSQYKREGVRFCGIREGVLLTFTFEGKKRSLLIVGVSLPHWTGGTRFVSLIFSTGTERISVLIHTIHSDTVVVRFTKCKKKSRSSLGYSRGTKQDVWSRTLFYKSVLCVGREFLTFS